MKRILTLCAFLGLLTSARSQVNIVLDSTNLPNTEKKLRIEMTNVYGQVLSSTQNNYHAGKNPARIDLDGYSPGVYFVKVSGSGFTATRNLIIE